MEPERRLNQPRHCGVNKNSINNMFFHVLSTPKNITGLGVPDFLENKFVRFPRKTIYGLQIPILIYSLTPTTKQSRVGLFGRFIMVTELSGVQFGL